MFALNQDHVRQALGNTRFILARRQDAELIDDAIATASAEAQERMARFDPQGKGYCTETVAYDLANLATGEIHRIRSRSPKNGAIGFTFKVEIGDYTFRMHGTQACRGGDIIAKVVGRAPSELAENPLDEAIIEALRNGCRVVTFDAQGNLDDLSWIPFNRRNW